ncbi:MAG: TolC family protein [Gemmatimonadota bacterium]
MTRWSFVTLAILAGTSSLAAQDPQPPARPTPTVTVSLAEALSQAQRNSPLYRQTLNDASAAHWGVRNATANALFPQLSVNGDLGYTGSGANQFSGTRFDQSSPSLSSGYGINLQWQVSGTTLSAPGQQRATAKAVDEDISGALSQLHYDIAFQYLTTLQATAQSDVARQQVTRNSDFLALAQARYQVGQATIIDVKQAQVLKGQADVALLRAIQAENEAKLELFRRIGVNLPAEIDQVGLSDSFPVTEPAWKLDQLLGMAAEQNPALRAVRAREAAATSTVRGQKSRYLPTLTLQAGWQAFTQEFTNENVLFGSALASAQGNVSNCEFQNDLIRTLPGGGIPGRPNGGIIGDCRGQFGLDATGSALQPGVVSAIRSQNNVFPFNFTKQPFSAGIRISLPIFDGFNRDLSIAQARNTQQDLEEGVRAQALRVRTDVHARYLGLQTNYKAIAVQQANREAARDQLQLAQDRYRLGSGSALEVSDAQNAVQKAEGDYVNAIYDYHKAIAALEFAVGRPLR